jgi:hypothetical protein
LAHFKPQKALTFAAEARCIKNEGLCDTLWLLRSFLGGSVSCCRFLHFRPHLVAFRRHVQFDEYIKGGSQLFPLPSREAKPSEGDLRITKRLVSAHEFFKSIFWIM